MSPRLRGFAAATALVLVAGGTGCSASPELQDVPMPTLVDGPTYELGAVFDSALNLPLQAPVKRDGATIGQVEAIEVRDFQAHVQMTIVDSAEIPEGSRAEIRLTSPMGTAFVELVDGDGAPMGAGSVIPATATDQAPDVSDLLSSLSVVVTGGSYADIKTIVDELNVALDGNADDVRRLLHRLEATMGSLQAHTADFDRALDGMHRLSTQLAADAPTLARAVTEITPAVRSLARQRETAMTLLAELRRFGRTSAHVVNASREELVSTLRDLDPVLHSLIRSRGRLVPIMDGIVEFGTRTDKASPGDYSNFDLTFELDPGQLLPDPNDPVNPDPTEPPDVPDVPDLPLLEDLPLQALVDSLFAPLVARKDQP